MDAVRCPFPGCTYSTPEGMEPAVTAVILSTHALSHSGAVKAKPAPIKRPEITSGGTTENLSYFVTRWKAYSGAVQLSGQDVTIQLLECCDSKLRRDITRNAVGPTKLEDMTEEGLLEAMRSLAVREENPGLRWPGQPLAGWYRTGRNPFEHLQPGCEARLKCVGLCTGCDVVSNHGEERVADQLCIGLADNEIQEDLLKDPNQDMSVEEMIRFIEVRASGKRSAASMTTPTSVNELGDGEGDRQRIQTPAVTPTSTTRTREDRPKATPLGPAHQREPGYPSLRATSTRGQSQRAPRTTPTKRGTCNFCGLQGHGEQERTAYRRVHCPAYGTTCTSCGRQNHTARVCWHSDIEHESAIFEQVDTMLEGTLNHQTWNRHTKCWTPRKSQPQPHLEVTIAARREDFRQHGHTLRQETQALTVDAMADTGCQSCLAGPQLLARTEA